MESTPQTHEGQRRSTRIRAQLPLRLTSLDPALQFSERCLTLVVNTQGCGVRLSRPLEPGTEVRLDELPSGLTVTARVANCIPLGSEGRFWLVGLALEKPGNVWGMPSAPADWGAQSAAATVPTSGEATKKNWPYSMFSRRGESHPGKKERKGP